MAANVSPPPQVPHPLDYLLRPPQVPHPPDYLPRPAHVPHPAGGEEEGEEEDLEQEADDYLGQNSDGYNRHYFLNFWVSAPMAHNPTILTRSTFIFVRRKIYVYLLNLKQYIAVILIQQYTGFFSVNGWFLFLLQLAGIFPAPLFVL